MPAGLEFDGLVELYHGPLYQFAFVLTGTEAEASALTQQAFNLWAAQGQPALDGPKAKAWLLGALHRAFLNQSGAAAQVSHYELSEGDTELPAIAPAVLMALDSGRVVDLLRRVTAPQQAAVALFYLEDCTHKEIGEILEIPPATVQLRITQGLAQFRQLIIESAGAPRGPAKEGLHG